jgi:hypothetical protein
MSSQALPTPTASGANMQPPNSSASVKASNVSTQTKKKYRKPKKKTAKGEDRLQTGAASLGSSLASPTTQVSVNNDMPDGSKLFTLKPVSAVVPSTVSDAAVAGSRLAVPTKSNTTKESHNKIDGGNSQAANKRQVSYAKVAKAGHSESQSFLPTETEPNSVVVQPVVNVLDMLRPQIKEILEGPTITICFGAQRLNKVSKRMGMALSQVLNDYFTKYPTSLEYRFGEGEVDPAAVEYLLVWWPKAISEDFESFLVPFRSTFREDVALLQASRTLYMGEYTNHILASYTDYLKNNLPAYDEITTILEFSHCNNASSSKDPLLTSVVKHLAHERLKHYIPDPEDFAKYLDEHVVLKKAMETTEKFYSKRFAKRKFKWQKTNAAPKNEDETEE